MEIYLTEQEIRARFEWTAAGLLEGVKLPLPLQLLAKQGLGMAKNAIGAPGSAAVVENLLRQLAAVYGYDLVFVKEIYRQNIEQAITAASPPAVIEKRCSCGNTEWFTKFLAHIYDAPLFCPWCGGFLELPKEEKKENGI
ncbi:MAG: hypothetical protein FWD39_01970 [Clostridiales bacterium]|nr:hypothetical protein [Clostridiales bacterium]